MTRSESALVQPLVQRRRLQSQCHGRTLAYSIEVVHPVANDGARIAPSLIMFLRVRQFDYWTVTVMLTGAGLETVTDPDTLAVGVAVTT